MPRAKHAGEVVAKVEGRLSPAKIAVLGDAGVVKTKKGPSPARTQSRRRAENNLSEYERERLENIRRNEVLLRSLGIDAAKGELAQVTTQKKTPSPVRKERRRSEPAPTPVPTRSSSRIRGEPAVAPTKREERALDENGECVDASEPEPIDYSVLKTAEEHFAADVVARAVRVDSHYHGWLHEEVRQRHGLEGSAADAWEKNGGGKFSFKNPLGAPDGGGARKSKSASDARLISAKLFRKNPNAYFYRHTEPGVEQWMGDWTEEEKATFVEVARKYGAGDKWGLFSSHIPHRVGYQCSNYYRQVILAEGLVIDPNYRFNYAGHAIYIGPHMRSTRGERDD